MMKSKDVIREAVGSGRWFPGRKAQLQSMVDAFLEGARVPHIPGRIVAAVSPHAGYVYSGKVAGYTFRALRDNAATYGPPETVVVLGLSHRGGFPGVALMDGDAVETPLGTTPLDKEASRSLCDAGERIFLQYAPHHGEHSAENQIPFVQGALPSASLVVGIVGDHDEYTIDALVSALNQLAKKKRIVVVASTDLLHDPDYDLVTETDKKTLQRMQTLDHKRLLAEWDYTRQTCCGVIPVVVAMRFAEAQGCTGGTVLHYENSGDEHPESRGNWVVGYGAVVFALKPL